MAAFTFTSPEGKSYTVNGPDGATQEQAFGILQQQIGGAQQPSVNPAVDFARSIPRGAVSGLTGALANIGKSGAIDAQFSGVPTADPDSMPTGPQGVAQIEQTTGPMYKPQGRAGRFGEAIGEGLGNPATYIGPGGLPLKIGGSILSSLGSEAGGQAAEGTSYEGAARLLGGAVGGASAAKRLGPAAPKALTPTFNELKQSANSGYNVARNSGLELNPKGIGDFAGTVQQELTNGPKYGFSGGEYGTAPKTLALLDDLQSAPPGARVTAPNLDTLRINIGNIAKETKDFKPTPDAKAAMVFKDRLAQYLENIPDDHIVAGKAEDYVRAIKQANGDYAAASRVGTVEKKLNDAVTNYEGSTAARLDNQIKSQIRPILKNPKAQRGFTKDEVGGLNQVNKGTLASRALSQAGRGGDVFSPVVQVLHAAVGGPAALATGGMSLLPQAAIAAALFGARKAGERMTTKQINKVIETLAQRSPLYQSRLKGLAAPDTITNKAAVLRGLLGPALQ